MSARAWTAGLVFSLAAGVLAADQADKPSAAELAKTAQERKNQVDLDIEIPQYADQESVKAIAEVGRARGKAELDRLNRAFEQQMQAEAGDDGEPKKERPPLAGRLVLAVSSSMPEALLREYLAQLDGVDEAVVVLRGFIGGASNVKPTGLWMEKATRTVAGDFKQRHRAVNVVIDPLLFRDLGIDRVPAVAWLPGVQDIRHCDEETYSAATVVYGASSIESALREIKRSGGQVPERLIARVGGEPWEHR